MTSTDRAGYESLCSFYGPLDVYAKAKSIQSVGKQASICFETQTLSRKDGKTLEVIPTKLRKGELFCRADGWYFTKFENVDGCGDS